MPKIPRHGAVSTLSLEIIRELSTEDLVELADKPPTSVGMVQALKESHHRQAQLIARGIYTDVTVARFCGVTPQRIYQLKKDPAFAVLVEHYRSQATEASIEASERVQSKLVVAGEAALDEINSRLEDEEKLKELPVGELRKIVEMAADRTVAPPKNSVPITNIPANITLNFGSELKKPEPKTIEIEGDPEG